MKLKSPIARHNRKRQRVAHARKRAPVHPIKPESNLRLAVAKLFNRYHRNIRDTLCEYAPRYLERKLGAHASADPIAYMIQDDEGDDDTAKPIHGHTHKILAAAVLAHLGADGKKMLRHSKFMPTLKKNAKDTAKSAERQVKEALNNPDGFYVDLSDETSMLADGVYDMSADRMDDSLIRAEDILDEWADMELPVVEDLGNKLDDGLSGILGSALASTSLIFAAAFADMNREAQQQNGGERYIWITRQDDRVRPAHWELEGQECSWDDPPLTADKSDNEEDCHPGDDYGCRCIASPVFHDDDEE